MSVNSLDLKSSPFAVNATTNNLPFVVTSPSASQAQFKLVTDIYIPQRSTSRLTRIKTAPSASLCMIDIASICSDYLTYDTPMYTVGGVGSFTNAAQFLIIMGEEYADSPSGSIVQYNGNGLAGEPAFTASFSGSVSKLGTLIPAVNELSNLSYDWPRDKWSMVDQGLTTTKNTPFLTNDPNFTLSGIINAGGTSTKKAHDYDWETISLITDGQYNEGINFVDVSLYSGSTNVQVFNDSNYYTTQVFTAALEPLHHIGIGPANISASDSSAASYIHNGDWTYLRFDFDFISGDNRVVEIYREPCYYYDQNLAKEYPDEDETRRIKGRTRFAFINKYGVMDYYNVNNPVKKSAKITRKDYTQPQLPWNTLSDTDGAIFDANKRGKDTYATMFTDQFEVTTDYLDQEYADWLTELIESPSVFIQSDSLNNQLNLNKVNFFEERAAIQNGFVPINIKNASYTWRTNKFKQKLYQYDLKWELSNTAETRR